jgi:polyvinyl alcohol dehydrogenase (cytochrome)
MMSQRAVATPRPLAVALLTLALGNLDPVWGTCPATYNVPGGGPEETDCHAEFGSPALFLNYPPFNPANPKKRRQVRCFDGEPGCDTDGVVNGVCSFPIDVCLRNADPALACTPADVTSVTVDNKPVSSPKYSPELAALQTALNALLPATSCACTSGQTIPVALKGDGKRPGRRTVKVSATAGAATDTDRLKLFCVPHGWPSHGYDHANHRASATEATISPANANQLVPAWQWTPGGGFTSTPTVGNGIVYATGWIGSAYALKAKTGALVWQYDSGASLQSSATLTADGRVLFGDSSAVLHCLNAKTGALIWKKALGDPAVDHIWASPTVANNRVFMGIASHSDNPCTRGRLIALDLDTGTELWTRYMVPEMVCDNDVSISCTSNGDCGTGICRPGRGAGVTASVAVDPTGENVFVNPVGCYTYPSIGDSDSIMRLEAATGATTWLTRVQPPEVFHTCSNDPAQICTPTLGLACVSPGTCSGAYHDFGFLNGPILVDADDGLGDTRPLVVSGSKDGSLYALNTADGSAAWTNVVAPAPVTPGFAGFGLFNGAVGYANGRFHAALNDHIPAITPAPKHLWAFSEVDGSKLWDDDIGASWGSMAIANGVIFVGANGIPKLFVYDAATGVRLKELALPQFATSGASIVDGMVYVGSGVASNGGVFAFRLP